MPSIDDIPVAFTPPGGYGDTMPPPILTGCADELAPDAPDLRGLWQVVDVTRNGDPLPREFPVWDHVERVEQAGNRVVITAAGIIHDMRADGTYEHGVRDVMQTDFTTPIVVAASFEGGVLVLRPQGVEGIEVCRRLDGEQMVWDYGPLFTARLVRVEMPR
jgi:hypothetical protein